MRKLSIFLILTVVAALFAVAYWPSPAAFIVEEEPFVHEFLALKEEFSSPKPPISMMKSQTAPEQSLIEAKELQLATKLLADLKPEEALPIIRRYQEQIDSDSSTGKQWLALLIRASEQLHDNEQLAILYDYFPRAFDDNEKAVLIVADTYITTGRPEDYQKIRSRWAGRSKRKSAWVMLDADRLLMEGERDEAISLLKSQSFNGKADTGRLVRLALLVAEKDPKEAWEFLTEAYKKDPHNADVRSYRARLLEKVGKDELALAEYIAATQTAPKDPFLREQLADFHLRRGNSSQALQLWSQNLKDNPLDTVWLNAFFWNRVLSPISFDWSAEKPPEGTRKPLLNYLTRLQPGDYWDEQTFSALQNEEPYLQKEQATFWLRLLQALKSGDEDQAWTLLQDNPFEEQSWAPDLERALKQVTTYRRMGVLSLGSEGDQGIQRSAHPFFAQLNFLAEQPQNNILEVIPSHFHELLISDDAYTALFLAAGWNEAALQFNTMTIVPEGYPSWMAYGLSEALRKNRSTLQSLEFATLQDETPAVNLLVGELLIDEGEANAGLDKLEPLLKENSDVGYRASWLSCLACVEREEYERAKKIIGGQPRLQRSVNGQEVLARIALLEGNPKVADQLYTAIEADSNEAKSYLARKAFADRDWHRAKELTQALLKSHPNNEVLLGNLQRISEKQQQIASLHD